MASVRPAVTAPVADSGKDVQTYQVLATQGQRITLWQGWKRVTYVGTRFAVPPNPYDRGWWRNVAEVWSPGGSIKCD